jgi:hypothetical protein
MDNIQKLNIYTDILCYLMQRVLWNVDSNVGGKNIILLNLKVYDRVYKRLPLDSVFRLLIESTSSLFPSLRPPWGYPMKLLLLLLLFS